MSIVGLDRPGLWSGVIAWSGEATWLGQVLNYAASSCGRAGLRAHAVSSGYLLAMARVLAAAADRDTGRGLALSNDTVAARMGRKSVRQVQRASRVLEEAGLLVTVAEGRYLTAAERRRSPGFIRRAAIRALTVPRRAFTVVAALARRVANVTLPRRGEVPRINSRSRIPPTRSYPQVPMPVKRLAAEVNRLRPGLLAGGHPDALGRVLMAHDVRPDVSASAMLELVDAVVVRYPERLTRPLGLFGWALGVARAGLATMVPVSRARRLEVLEQLEPVDDRLARAGLPPRAGHCQHRDPFGHGWCVVCGDRIPEGQDEGEPDSGPGTDPTPPGVSYPPGIPHRQEGGAS